MRVLALLLLVACETSALPPPQPPVLACNGSARLCDLRFDQVAFAAAHNAMSNSEDGWQIPNQHRNMVHQLDDGIRAFLIDVHEYDGDDVALQQHVMLCHGVCALGQAELSTELAKIKAWLDAHPHEVIAFVIEDYVTEAQLDVALQQSGLRDLCLHMAQGEPFPTLRTMLAKNQRLFVMLETGGGTLPWNHRYPDFAWDTPYAAATPAEFSCQLLRGKKSNPLFLLNHFLTKGLSDHAVLSEQANHDPLLHDRIAQCVAEAGRKPNFVAVDMYDIGDVLAEVRALNGL